MARAVALAWIFTLAAPVVTAAQQGPVVGRWVPIDLPADDPLIVWEFASDGVVITTLRALPGAAGTYRFDGRDLTHLFEDGSEATSRVTLTDDSMVQRSSEGVVRLTRVGPVADSAHPLRGTWAVESPARIVNRIAYQADGTVQMQSVTVGGYSVTADTVSVHMPDSPMPTIRFRISDRGEETVLVGLDVRPDFHPPTLRRAR